MDFKKVNCVALLVSLRAKALNYLYLPPRNGGATSGDGGWICLRKGQNVAILNCVLLHEDLYYIYLNPDVHVYFKDY